MTRVADLPVLPGVEPVFGHVRRMQRDRLGFLHDIAHDVDRLSRFGTVAAEGAIANHPEVLAELFVEKARVFDKSFITRFALGPLGGEGLFTSRYDLWRGQRRIMAPLFHPSQLARYASDMVRCAERVTSEWSDGETFELLRETTRMTMSIAGKTLFDAETLGEADAIGRALNTTLDWAAKNSPGPLAIAHLLAREALVRGARALPQGALANTLRETASRFERPVALVGESGRKLKAAVAVLDAEVERMIATRRREAALGRAPTDLLARLLAAQDDDGTRMTDRQLRDEVLTLFVAGHETTATGLAWTVHCLCQNRDVYAAVQREVDALGHEPSLHDLPALDLTLRVFKEALRLYPPVYLLGRQATTETTLDGVAFGDRAIVLVAPFALHRRRDLWPNPERFDPSRFVAAEEAKRHRLAWLPFGAGPRVCIGNHFALMEAQLVLATMLRRAEFEATDDETPLAGATLRPKHGVRVRVKVRQKKATQWTGAELS